MCKREHNIFMRTHKTSHLEKLEEDVSVSVKSNAVTTCETLMPCQWQSSYLLARTFCYKGKKFSKTEHLKH